MASLLGLITMACSTSRVEVSQQASLNVSGDESVVILARRHENAEQPEDSFMDCLRDSLEHDASRLYPSRQFVDALFPWFEPRTAPTSTEDLARLIARPDVSRKIRSMRVRYMIWVEGDTDTVDQGGGLSCAVGPGGGGCFGFVWWDKDSSYEVSIWDLQRAESVGAMSSEVLGTSYVPALIIPLPLIARTQSTACNGLAEQLETMFASDAPS
jgi:hypothetical protein